MRLRLVLLAATLPLVAACASGQGGMTLRSPAPGKPEKGAAASDPTPGAPTTGPAALEGPAKTSFYQRLDQLAETWQRSAAETGERAAADSLAAESAAGGLAWGQMEMVLQDLRESPNPRWRSTAARGLGFVNDARALPALEGVLGEPDPRLLCSALVSLARIADVAADDARIARLLRSSDPLVRGNAALALARVFQARRRQDMPAVSPSDRAQEVEADLSVLLFDPGDSIVRGNAAQALGGLGSPGAEDALMNRLRDEATFARLKTAQALALCGTQRSFPPLLDALGREGEGNVRTMLALALGAIAERRGLVPPHADLGTDAAKWRAWLQR